MKVDLFLFSGSKGDRFFEVKSYIKNDPNESNFIVVVEVEFDGNTSDVVLTVDPVNERIDSTSTSIVAETIAGCLLYCGSKTVGRQLVSCHRKIKKKGGGGKDEYIKCMKKNGINVGIKTLVCAGRCIGGDLLSDIL